MLGLFHEMGDEHDRHTLIADALDQRPGVAARLGIEPGRQLVEHRDPRIPDQRQRDREALLLPARQLREPGGALLGKPERLAVGPRIEPEQEIFPALGLRNPASAR